MPFAAETMSRARPAWLTEILEAAGIDPAIDLRTRWDDAHSNDVGELIMPDGRVMVLKRGRNPWSHECFTTSALAARLIAAESDILVPQPLALRTDASGSAIQAYWRIALPTLSQIWPDLSTRQRAAALRSAGGLLGRLHEVRLPGFGPLPDQPTDASLADELDRELRRRLLPAVTAHWPAGVPQLERLIEQAPDVAAACSDRDPSLIHNDLHLGNLLCSVRDGRVSVVGLLDLDDAIASVAESDIACFEVLHGALFEYPVQSAVRDELRAGHAAPLDPDVLRFFRRVHLVNQGFSSSLLGHHEHAAGIEACLRDGNVSGMSRRHAAAAGTLS